jgi:hypothetical protein
MIYTMLYLLLGIVGTIPLLIYAHNKPTHTKHIIYGQALIIAAMVYVGFAIYAGNLFWLAIETAGVLVYATLYFASKRWGVYLLAIAWLLHPAWDVGLHLLGAGADIAPYWYAVACMSFDVVIGVYLLIWGKQ